MSPPHLRPAGPDDLPFVLALEASAREGGFVLGWGEGEHRAALADPDVGHFVVEAEPSAPPAGFVIVRGLAGPHGSVEFKRVVVAERGRGLGRAVVREVKRLAFERWGAHRLWLDVFEHNARARALYASEGFVVEGVLRECVLLDGRRASLVVMSILRGEYGGAAGAP